MEWERETDGAERARLERSIRDHDRGRLSQWLAGKGRLELHTLPTAAAATLYRYVERDRMLVPERVADLGKTPVSALVDEGSYLVHLEASGLSLRYPVLVRRDESSGVTAARPISLDPGPLAEGEIYIPAGWTWIGGDRQAKEPLRLQRVWVASFVAHRFSITAGEYLEFLNDLAAAGNLQEALAYAPRHDGTRRQGAPQLFPIVADRFTLPNSENGGETWTPDLPMMNVDWYGADAYARWRARRAGLPWRLPSEAEWVRAARGGDQRLFPWGNAFDSSRCNMRDTGSIRPRPVTDMPDDVSPFGVRGIAGSISTWTSDPFDPAGVRVGSDDVALPPSSAPEGEWFMYRGGAWNAGQSYCRISNRGRYGRSFVVSALGLRLVRPLD